MCFKYSSISMNGNQLATLHKHAISAIKNVIYKVIGSGKLTFVKFYRVMEKIIILKLLNLQGKMFIMKENGITFSKASQNPYFMRSYRCVACPLMSCFILFFSFCWLVVLWHFPEVFVVFCSFSLISNMKCCWELARIVLLVSLNVNPDRQVVKLASLYISGVARVAELGGEGKQGARVCIRGEAYMLDSTGRRHFDGRS